MQKHTELKTLLVIAFIYMSAQLVYIQMQYTDTSALVYLTESIVEEFRQANPPREIELNTTNKHSLSTSTAE